MTDVSVARKMPPALKLALELGPLLLFFIAYTRFGILPATGVLMVAVLVALFVTRALTGHWPTMPLVTAVMILVFGGLTLVLHDATFTR